MGGWWVIGKVLGVRRVITQCVINDDDGRREERSKGREKRGTDERGRERRRREKKRRE